MELSNRSITKIITHSIYVRLSFNSDQLKDHWADAIKKHSWKGLKKLYVSTFLKYQWNVGSTTPTYLSSLRDNGPSCRNSG